MQTCCALSLQSLVYNKNISTYVIEALAGEVLHVGFACAGQAPYTCLSEIDDRGASLHVSYLVHESCWLSTKNVRYKDQHQVGMGRTQKSVSSLPNTGSSTQLKLLVSYVPRARVMQGMTSWQVMNFYHQIIKRSSPADKSLPASLVPQPWHVRDKELQLRALC